MSIKIGINGFGRIGRLVFRAGINRPDIEFLGINDPGMTPTIWPICCAMTPCTASSRAEISYDEESIIVNGKKIMFYAKMNPSEIPWGELGVEYVVESTACS